MERILVEEGKHDTAYWAATSDEELHASALAILGNRLNYFHVREVPAKVEYDLSNLPEEFHKEAEKNLKRNTRNIAEAKHENSLHKNAHEAVEKKDGLLAWRILQQREDYQYESVILKYAYNPLKEQE